MHGLLASVNCYLLTKGPKLKLCQAPLGRGHESYNDGHFGTEGNAISLQLILWLEEGKAIISLHRDRRASSF